MGATVGAIGVTGAQAQTANATAAMAAREQIKRITTATGPFFRERKDYTRGGLVAVWLRVDADAYVNVNGNVDVNVNGNVDARVSARTVR